MKVQRHKLTNITGESLLDQTNVKDNMSNKNSPLPGGSFFKEPKSSDITDRARMYGNIEGSTVEVNESKSVSVTCE